MPVDLQIVEAVDDHIATIAERMRQADRDEVMASGGKTPVEALSGSLAKSSQVWTAIVDGRPEVMFGVGDLNVLTRTGCPWLLGTDAVTANYRLFLRQSIMWREQLLGRYDILRNAVDDRNEVSKRWLQWMGFTLYEPMPLGVNGEPFRVFEMRR